MSAQSSEQLPQGYHLGDYVIERRIGGGGFSLVYLAFDMDGQPVAVKEYLPGGVVKRGDTGTVQPVSEDKHASFRYGMKCFFEEGRTLAAIRHPNVVRVLNFFRANDTVYMVMKYEQGKTLQKLITGMDDAMRESFLRRVFVQLLNGLREVHTHKTLHLDIKPSNIYIRSDGSPVLIDFGAARNALAHDLTIASPMYTPGFAAPEQYNQRDRMGPWTDIYSVGASMYACIARLAPQPADDRVDRDRMVPLAKSHGGQFSRELLELIDNMMRLNYTERPQSVFSVQKRLVTRPDVVLKARPTLFNMIKDRLTKEL